VKNSYDYLAQFYDELIEVDYNDWANYLTKFFMDDSKNILDIGCGTAMLTNEIYKRGYNVTAVDTSVSMLNVAWNNYANKFPIIKQDIRELNLGQKYDVVTCNCDVINYILSVDDLEKTFQGVYNHLLSNGRFVFDISSRYKLKEILGEKTFFEDNEEMTYVWSNNYNEDLINMEITFFIPERDSKYYKRYDEQHIQKAWSIKDIKDSLLKTGFNLDYVFEFFTNEEPNNTSERILFVASHR